MSEQFQQVNPSPSEPAGEEDVVALIKKVQQQLIFLEKKIDTLINNQAAQPRPFGEKPFSKPYRSFDRPQRSFERDRGSSPRGRSFERPSHFGKRHDEEGEGSGYKRKAYGDSREGGSEQGSTFKKPYGGKKRGFDQKSKPFYGKYKQKDRG